MSFLITDGVVPSNEDRGYVLRRIMRRAILQGRHTLELEPGFLGRYADVVSELMGGEYGELYSRRDEVQKWLESEEESFGRTLTQGSRLLDDLIERARELGAEGICAEDAFRLHDTYGFPIDLRSSSSPSTSWESMRRDSKRSWRIRAHARAPAAAATVGARCCGARARALRRGGLHDRFRRLPDDRQRDHVGATATDNGRVLAKLVSRRLRRRAAARLRMSATSSAPAGDCRARVDDVLRLGDDQVLALVPERGSLEPGERVVAHVDRAARHATECNHTATHLLHAALRRRLGTHVHQAGSYVGPDKLRFDFTHGGALTAEELREIEDQVNEWILESQPVHAITTTLAEARRLGAMALFGEKYGDIVRMVEVGDGSFSRELCGGTHVSTSSEIALCKITSETSSAANVRRIEALTGPAAVELMGRHDRWLAETGEVLRVPVERVPDEVSKLRTQVRELARTARHGGSGNGSLELERLLSAAAEIDGARIVTAAVDRIDGKALLDLADRLKAKLGDAAIVLGSAGDDRVDLIASVAPSLVARGVRASEIVKAAASVVGGGGGGRDTLARAGGREPAKLPDAIDAARKAIEAALAR